MTPQIWQLQIHYWGPIENQRFQKQWRSITVFCMLSDKYGFAFCALCSVNITHTLPSTVPFQQKKFLDKLPLFIVRLWCIWIIEICIIFYIIQITSKSSLAQTYIFHILLERIFIASSFLLPFQLFHQSSVVYFTKCFFFLFLLCKYQHGRRRRLK